KEDCMVGRVNAVSFFLNLRTRSHRNLRMRFGSTTCTRRMTLFIAALVLLTCLPVGALDAATSQKLQDAAEKSIPIQSNIKVADNVSVEAVLLPERVCKEVFGKEIAQNYAAIELTISN